MHGSLHASSIRLELVLPLALAAIALGAAAGIRIDAVERSGLLALAAASLAVGMMIVGVVSPQGSSRRVLSVAAIAACAAMSVVQEPKYGQTSAAEWLFWGLALAGVVGWIGDTEALAKWTVAACVPVAIVIFVLPSFAATASQLTFVHALPAALACFALGAALMTALQMPPTSRTKGPLDAPLATRLISIALWASAGVYALAASISSDPAWPKVTVFGLVAAVLADTRLAALTKVEETGNGGSSESAFWTAALVVATGLAATAPFSTQPYGVQMAGAALAAVVSIAVLARRRAHRTASQFEHYRQRAAESRTDALTGLANRRAFEERIVEEVARAERYGHPLSLLMIDIDDFKQVNDRFGHSAGDRALQELAGVLLQSIRAIDVAARFGGEEFAIVLPETGVGGATVVAERVRTAARRATFSLSIGVAELCCGRQTSQELVEAADHALYQAKRAGKHRVEIAM